MLLRQRGHRRRDTAPRPLVVRRPEEWAVRHLGWLGTGGRFAVPGAVAVHLKPAHNVRTNRCAKVARGSEGSC